MQGRSARPGEPVDRGRILLALRSGRPWILVAAVLGLFGALALVLWVVPPRYVARTAVVWEQAVSVQSEAEAARQLRTMVDGIVLPENLIAIRARRKLGDVELTDIAARLSVDYDRESNLVTIGATDRNPRRAAALANTAASVFVQHRRRFEAERRRELVRALDDDLRRARGELAAARVEYDAFRHANGIADLPAETQRAIETAAALRAQADLAQGDVVAEQSRARALRSQVRRVASPGASPAAPPELSPEQRAIEARLAQTRLELVEARSRFSSAHPDVQRLESALAALRTQRVAPPPAVPPRPGAPRPIPGLSTTSGRSEAAQEKQRTYARLAAEAEQHLQQLSQQQGEAARLLAAQGFAEAHLAELTALRSPVMDEARSPITGLRVFSIAVPPEQPEPSAARPILFLTMPLLLAFLSMIVLVARQLYRRRVHTAREVAYWGQGVAVASTRWPRGDAPLRTLVAELADEAIEAEGSTLIVASAPGDAELARTLATQLRAATAPRVQSQAHVAEVVLVPAAPTRRRTMRPGLPPFPDVLPDAAEPESPAAGPALESPLHDELARRIVSTQGVRVHGAWRGAEPKFVAWGGPLSGATLRRLARLADRVLVLVRSGSTSIHELATVRASVGREEGVGFVVLDVDEALEKLPDRAGPVAEYWRGSRQ